MIKLRLLSSIVFASLVLLGCGRSPSSDRSPQPTPTTTTTTNAANVAEPALAPTASFVSGTRVIIKVVSVRDKVPGVLGAAPSGMKYVALELLFENDRGNTYSVPTILAYYRLKGKDGTEILPNWVLANASPMLQSGDLTSGDKKRGWVNFQVPADFDLANARFQFEFERRATTWIPLSDVANAGKSADKSPAASPAKKK
jgi:hypothetical protein